MNNPTMLAKRLIPKDNARSMKIKFSTRAIIQIVLLIWATIVLLPLFWLFLSSLKTQQDLASNIWGFPKRYVLENYVLAWTKSYMARYMLNSVIAATTSVIITVAATSTLSYVLARFNFRLNRAIYFLIIAGMMIPIHSAVIPLYLMALKGHMMNNLLFLGLIYAAFRIPISVFILESFMISIPKEMEESAIMDGCSYYRIFFQIVLPLSKDGIVTITILAVLASWNELLVSMLMISKPLLKTLPIGLMGFITDYNTEYTILCAGLLIAIVPSLIFYALLQKSVVKGMTMGAVKG